MLHNFFQGFLGLYFFYKSIFFLTKVTQGQAYPWVTLSVTLIKPNQNVMMSVVVGAATGNGPSPPRTLHILISISLSYFLNQIFFCH